MAVGGSGSTAGQEMGADTPEISAACSWVTDIDYGHDPLMQLC